MSRYPSWRCQRCGEPIGWLGRAMEWLFGSMHTCHPDDEAHRRARANAGY